MGFWARMLQVRDDFQPQPSARPRDDGRQQPQGCLRPIYAAPLAYCHDARRSRARSQLSAETCAWKPKMMMIARFRQAAIESAICA